MDAVRPTPSPGFWSPAPQPPHRFQSTGRGAHSLLHTAARSGLGSCLCGTSGGRGPRVTGLCHSPNTTLGVTRPHQHPPASETPGSLVARACPTRPEPPATACRLPAFTKAGSPSFTKPAAPGLASATHGPAQVTAVELTCGGQARPGYVCILLPRI